MNDCKINFKKLIVPIFVWVAGLVLIIVSAPKTTYVNGMVALGFFALCIGTYWTLYALYREYDKTEKEWPAFFKQAVPELSGDKG